MLFLPLPAKSGLRPLHSPIGLYTYRRVSKLEGKYNSSFSAKCCGSQTTDRKLETTETNQSQISANDPKATSGSNATPCQARGHPHFIKRGGSIQQHRSSRNDQRWYYCLPSRKSGNTSPLLHTCLQMSSSSGQLGAQ